MFIKLSSKAKEYPLKGRLCNNGNYIYLKVDNGIFDPFLKMIDKKDVIHPEEVTEDKKNVGAHITVIKAKEGKGLDIEELGDEFEFYIDGFETVDPEGWEEVKKVYFLTVRSEGLEDLREKYNLSRKINGHSFHITVGVEKSALNWYSKIKLG